MAGVWKPELGLRSKLLLMAATTIVAVAVVGGAYLYFQAQIDRATTIASAAENDLDEISGARVTAGSLLAATQAFYLTHPTRRSPPSPRSTGS